MEKSIDLTCKNKQTNQKTQQNQIIPIQTDVV